MSMNLPLAVIIEDDPQLSHIFDITLRQYFAIETFMDGDTASDRLQQILPALIVLDLNIPGIPGRKLLDQIRGDARLKKTRVILTTADDRQAEILRDHVDVVLLKPVSPALLRDLAMRMRPPGD